MNATDKGISSYKVTEIFRKMRRSYENLKDEVASNKNSIVYNQDSISNLNNQIMNCCEKLDKLFDPIKFKIEIMSTIAKLDDKINSCVIKFQEDLIKTEQKKNKLQPKPFKAFRKQVSNSIPMSSGTDMLKCSDIPNLEYSETPKFKGKMQKSKIKKDDLVKQSTPQKKILKISTSIRSSKKLNPNSISEENSESSVMFSISASKNINIFDSAAIKDIMNELQENKNQLNYGGRRMSSKLKQNKRNSEASKQSTERSKKTELKMQRIVNDIVGVEIDGSILKYIEIKQDRVHDSQVVDSTSSIAFSAYLK